MCIGTPASMRFRRNEFGLSKQIAACGVALMPRRKRTHNTFFLGTKMCDDSPCSVSAASMSGFAQGRMRMDAHRQVLSASLPSRWRPPLPRSTPPLRRRPCRRRESDRWPDRRSLWSSPSLRPSVVARPEKPQRNRPILTSRSCFLASVSVSPHQAISGSVKTTAGWRADPRPPPSRR